MSRKRREERKTDALAKVEPKLETLSRYGRDTQAARGSNGQFVSRAEALQLRTQKSVTKSAYTPNSEGKTKLDLVIDQALDIAAQNEDAKNLGPVSQLILTVDEISGQKLVRQRLARETQDKNPVLKVIINAAIPGIQMMEERKYDPNEKPSWAQAEVVSTNPPAPVVKEEE